MSRRTGRREFLGGSAGVALAGLGLSRAQAKPPTATRPVGPGTASEYKVKWYPFTEHPDSDSCWSLSVGPDGRIYAAACAESVPGGVVKVVRDFVLRLRPRTSERSQVFVGRVAIVVAMLLGIAAAYLVYLTPDGLYKYLQTISIYLVMPVTPAIIFGIMSRRVTLAGAIASVLVGVGLATIFVTDQLMGAEAGRQMFPWLHHTLTLNYTYRGLWGTLCIIATLFLVSAWTAKTAPAKLEATTIRWGGRVEPFEGLSDWHLQLGLLGLVTVMAYWLLW